MPGPLSPTSQGPCTQGWGSGARSLPEAPRPPPQGQREGSLLPHSRGTCTPGAGSGPGARALQAGSGPLNRTAAPSTLDPGPSTGGTEVTQDGGGGAALMSASPEGEPGCQAPASGRRPRGGSCPPGEAACRPPGQPAAQRPRRPGGTASGPGARLLLPHATSSGEPRGAQRGRVTPWGTLQARGPVGKWGPAGLVGGDSTPPRPDGWADAGAAPRSPSASRRTPQQARVSAAHACINKP